MERTNSPRDAMSEERETNDYSVKPTEMRVIMASEPCKVDDTGDDDRAPESTREQCTQALFSGVCGCVVSRGQE